MTLPPKTSPGDHPGGGRPLPNPLGRQLLVELYDCDHTFLNHLESVKNALIEITKIVNLTVIDVVFHEYSPHGITGVVVIAESHITVHTWPEYGYAAVDIFTCGEAISPRILQPELQRCFKAKDSTFQVVERGPSRKLDLI